MKKLFLIFIFIIFMVALFKANIFDFEDVILVEKTIRCSYSDSDWMLQVYSDGSTAISPIGDLPLNVIIPSEMDGYVVTKVADYAFSGYKDLKTIEFGKTITEIGNYAFWDCKSLVSVTFGADDLEIKENAFMGCSEKLIEKVKNAHPDAIWS